MAQASSLDVAIDTLRVQPFNLSPPSENQSSGTTEYPWTVFDPRVDVQVEPDWHRFCGNYLNSPLIPVAFGPDNGFQPNIGRMRTPYNEQAVLILRSTQVDEQAMKYLDKAKYDVDLIPGRVLVPSEGHRCSMKPDST